MNEHEKKPKKYLYMMLAILSAIAMWIFVDELDQRTVQVVLEDIPVTYVDAYDELSERGLMLVRGEGSTTTETIDLTLEGRRRLMADLDESDVTVTVDISDFDRVGNRQRATRNISYSDSKFNALKINTATTITVDIAELNRRTVDVRCELIGNVAEGFSAGEVQLSHTEVEIRGQTKDIDPVSYVKVSFDIGKDAEESITQELRFQYYDRNDNLLDSEGIIPTVEIVTAKLPVYVTKELPLVINYQEAPGARLFNTDRELTPSTITVSGDASQLKNVKNIVLGDVDLLDLTDESTRYETTFPIIIPDGCKNLSGVTRATLKIRFKDLVTTELTAFEFDYENLPEGKTARILTEELTVTFFGNTEDIESLTSDDILVVADLSDYGSASGTYTVPATVTVTNGADVGVVGQYQVEARIRPAPADETTETVMQE
ncbi:MAG: hypothetical protein IJX52_02625 [Oscillibacter sp.]|nr:hypothetical protein [Oscillibacter sp.]